MHAAPFANSVAVGTEGCAGVVEALDAAADSVTLLRLVVAGAKPHPGSMLTRAIAGQTTATAMAERLVAEEGLSFREAHHAIGERLTDRRIDTTELDPAEVARSARFGGGPGGPAALDDLRHRRAAIATDMLERHRRWRRADVELAQAVAAVTAPVMAAAGQG
jgi:argininosuccinate lyase